MSKFQSGDFADYTWPLTYGKKAVRVIIKKEGRESYFVVLQEDLINFQGKKIRAGRWHICGTEWLVPIEESD